MNKKAITLICIFLLLASLQLACSFSEYLGNLGQGEVHSSPQENLSLGSTDQQDPSGQDLDPGSSHPAGNPANCTQSFAASTNTSEGQEFQAGDIIQVSITLINTGTCSWDAAYSLIEMGGDLSPSSSSLALSGAVAAGDSVQLQTSYTAPSQAGVYLSIWKMQDPQGIVFGLNDPPDTPLRTKIRVIPSGNPQPAATPSPTQQPQNNNSSAEMTLLEDQCFDFNSGSVVDCSASSADFRYSYNPLGGMLYKANYNTFGGSQTQEPDKSACQGASYLGMPFPIPEGKYICFRIETVASTVFGWMYIERLNEDGLTFEFSLFDADPPAVAPILNTSLFVESQGEQITLLEGECYDIWNGQKNSSCSGTFAGFLFEAVTKKNLQTSQINPNEIKFSAAMSSQPDKSDCQNASYNTNPIWPISSTSYYCYQFVPGTTVYYGWLRPTSFNLGGLTFDYLTWVSSP